MDVNPPCKKPGTSRLQWKIIPGAWPVSVLGGQKTDPDSQGQETVLRTVQRKHSGGGWQTGLESAQLYTPGSGSLLFFNEVSLRKLIKENK